MHKNYIIKIKKLFEVIFFDILKNFLIYLRFAT